MFKKIKVLALTGVMLVVGGQSAFAYEVKSGDTMSKVASNHSMSLLELSNLNPGVTNLDLIYIGQKLNTNTNESQKVSSPVKVVENNSSATSYEVDLMARLVRAEAESESYAGKVAVASVVLNRVESSQFPNSIKDVIYQKGQFSPVASGSINRSADAESIKAVKEALNGVDNTKGSLFFYNPRTATSRWLDSKQTVTTIGNHVFK